MVNLVWHSSRNSLPSQALASDSGSKFSSVRILVHTLSGQDNTQLDLDFRKVMGSIHLQSNKRGKQPFVWTGPTYPTGILFVSIHQLLQSSLEDQLSVCLGIRLPGKCCPAIQK